jgi:hypothetical protein
MYRDDEEPFDVTAHNRIKATARPSSAKRTENCSHCGAPPSKKHGKKCLILALSTMDPDTDSQPLRTACRRAYPRTAHGGGVC